MRGRRARDADDVLAGRRPERRARHDGPGRTDGLAEFVAVLHASREVEPAPRMTERLRAQIATTGPAGAGAGLDGVPTLVGGATDDDRCDRDDPSDRPSARPGCPGWRRPTHLSPSAAHSLVRMQQRRAAVSVAAAAALLAGLVLATNRPAGEAPAGDGVTGLGSSSGAGLRPPEGAPSDPDDALTPPTTTGATGATDGAGSPGAATGTGPAPAVPSTGGSAGPPGAPGAPGPAGDAAGPDPTAPAFGQPVGRNDGNRDGDRDGDADGTGAGSGSGSDAGPVGGGESPSSSGREGPTGDRDGSGDPGGAPSDPATPPTTVGTPTTPTTTTPTTTPPSTEAPPTTVDPRGEPTPGPGATTTVPAPPVSVAPPPTDDSTPPDATDADAGRHDRLSGAWDLVYRYLRA